MNFAQLQGAVELGLIYSLVSLGAYLSFRVLRFPDLTVDGSFPLGAAVCAAAVSKGVHPIAAVLLAPLAGMLAGWTTATLSNRLKMLNLLAGILTMSALYSINLRVLGNKPSLSLVGVRTIFDGIPAGIPPILSTLLVIVVGVALGVTRALQTQTGLGMRAAGSNSRMAGAQGIHQKKMIALGLAISNGCVALAGALFAQTFGFADVTLGVGTIIIALASLILGEGILPNRTTSWAVIGCIGGTLLYRILIASALNLGDLGLQASDLNLITAVLVALAMGIPMLTRREAK